MERKWTWGTRRCRQVNRQYQDQERDDDGVQGGTPSPLRPLGVTQRHVLRGVQKSNMRTDHLGFDAVDVYGDSLALTTDLAMERGNRHSRSVVVD